MTQEFVTLPLNVVERALKALSLALSDVDWRQDSPAQPVIHRAYNATRAALEQPQLEKMTDEQKDAARWRHMKQGGCDWLEILGRVRSDLDCDLDQAVDEAIQRAHNIK